MHQSQTDAAKGFGGKFGVQTDRQDKSAVGFGHKETVEKHASQKGLAHYPKGSSFFTTTDHSYGFGGKFGVQQDRRDKSAMGYEYQQKLEQHESQTGP